MAATAQTGLPTARLRGALPPHDADPRLRDRAAWTLFGEKLIRGSVHPYVGQEAIAVGVCDTLTEADFITSTHRGHGHCIAKGLDLRLMMAEITGRESGYCRGKGGSMHITAMRHGMLGADAIVGGSLAIAVGAAHGRRLQGADTVTVAFFGDGASNQGIFHEAANLAAILKAPDDLRVREQPVGDLDAVRARRRRCPTSRCARRATASPAWSSTATTCRPCARSPRRPWSAPAPARGRR